MNLWISLPYNFVDQGCSHAGDHGLSTKVFWSGFGGVKIKGLDTLLKIPHFQSCVFYRLFFNDVTFKTPRLGKSLNLARFSLIDKQKCTYLTANKSEKYFIYILYIYKLLLFTVNLINIFWPTIAVGERCKQWLIYSLLTTSVVQTPSKQTHAFYHNFFFERELLVTYRGFF